jgi:hypothetical protein
MPTTIHAVGRRRPGYWYSKGAGELCCNGRDRRITEELDMDKKTEGQKDQGADTAPEPKQPDSGEARHEDLDPGEKAAEVKGGRVKFIR